MPLTQLKASRGTTATGTADSTTFLRGDNSWASAGAAAGQVIQVKTATDSTTRSTSSDTYVTGSNTLTLSITPSSSANKILLMVSTSITANVYSGKVTIFKNGSNLLTASPADDCFASATGFGSNMAVMTGIHYLDSPATTSATTYQVYMKVSAGGLYLNWDSTKGSITCLEIKG